MSIHPSLNLSEKDKKQRTVLKRIERLRLMAEKNQWTENDSVYGLPKIKTIRIKIKKEKAEKVETAATAEGAVPAIGETKGQVTAKAPAPKGPAAKAPAPKATEKK